MSIFNIPPHNKNIKEIALELALEYKETVGKFSQYKAQLDFMLVKLAVMAAWIDFQISPMDAFFLKDFFLLYLGYEEHKYAPILKEARIQVQKEDFEIGSLDLPESAKIFAFRFWLTISKADQDLTKDYLTIIEARTQKIKQKLFSANDIAQKPSDADQSKFGGSVQDIGDKRVSESALKEPDETASGEAEAETLEVVLGELNSLIGLKTLKGEIETLFNFLQIQKQRRKEGLGRSQIQFHCVFSGNPGTGKTTVARLFGKALKSMGFIRKGHLVESDRSGLVGQYIGHTAIKTDALVQTALDGVLFIDEAYSLVKKSDQGADFGSEAIDILIKRMEDFSERLVIIVAGYTNKMNDFIASNPGLQSRFTNNFEFPDYSPDELFSIFRIFCKKENYVLQSETEERLTQLITKIYENKTENFGNGRSMRNLFQRIIRNQANRLTKLNNISKDDLLNILPEDIPDAFF